MTQEIKIYDDPNLVEYRTDLEGWTGPDGLYYGKGDLGEQRARYANCTHKRCECGDLVEKGWWKCENCREKSARERYYKKELVEWDGKSWLYDDTLSEYFESVGEIFERYEEEDLDINDAKVLLAEQRVGINYVDLDELNEESGTEDEGVMALLFI